MKKYNKTPGLLTALIALTFSTQVSAQGLDSIKVVAPKAVLKKVSDQFKFTEGPAVDKKGNIFFTDQPNDKIWKYDVKGELSLFMDQTGRSNGLYFDKKGNIIACADLKNELWSIAPDKTTSVLMPGSLNGKGFNGPNDLWIDPKGGIYFTDPYYQRDYWERKSTEMDGMKVYYLPKDSKTPVVADDKLVQPNGIVGTPDGKHLFVADIRDNKTYKYDIAKDGSLSNRRLFVEQGSDGITLDSEGNLYLSGRGVTVYDRSGGKIGNIPVPSRWVGNLCFGGRDRKTLLITASESVYTLKMNYAGVE